MMSWAACVIRLYQFFIFAFFLSYNNMPSSHCFTCIDARKVNVRVCQISFIYPTSLRDINQLLVIFD